MHLIVISKKVLIFVLLDPPMGVGEQNILIKTLPDVYLLPSNLAVYDTRRRNGNGSVHFQCISMRHVPTWEYCIFI